MVWDIKKVKQICEVRGKVLGDIVGDYYFRSIQGLDMSYSRYPNRVLSTGTFLENKTEKFWNQLKVDGYMIPLHSYAITRQ